MIKVNLLTETAGASTPRDWLPREQRSALLGLSMLMVTALGVGGWWYYLHHTRAMLDVRVAKSEAELVRLKDAAKLVSDTAARKAELNERLALIQQLRATKRGPVSLLETVSGSMPDGMWLLDMKETGTSVQIDGRATTLTSVTDFTERLQDSGLFQRPVEILTTTTETIEDTNLVRFSVKAEVAPPPVAGSTSAAPGTPTTGSGSPVAATTAASGKTGA